MALASRPRSGARSLLAGGTAVAAVALLLSGLVLADPAEADPGLSATPTTTTTVLPNSTTTLAGLHVDGAGSGTDVLATVSTDVGTLAVMQTSGLTLAYGNAWTGDSSLTFNGTRDDVNAGLASVELTQTASSGTDATVTLIVRPNESGKVYAAPNKHFYEFVAAPHITWDDARADALTRSYLGQQGYLASLPSAAINDLVSTRLEGALNVWIGARSSDSPFGSPARVWKWNDGPLTGTVISNCTNWDGLCDFSPSSTAFSSWSPGEPNNVDGGVDNTPNSGEWVAVTNWGVPDGEWNDWPNDSAIPGSIDVAGYVVEYGDQETGATGFVGLEDASSVVQIRNAPTTTTAPTTTAPTTTAPTTPTPVPALSAPRGLVVKPGDRVLTLSFRLPAHTGGRPILSYQVSLDGGRTWKKLPVTGRSTKTAKVEGVLNGKTYAVKVRAVNSAGSGPAARVTTTTRQWFHDPLTTKQRSRLIAVPKHPAQYHGKVRTTTAKSRSHSGRPAMSAPSLRGRKLQAGQAVTFTRGGIFAFDSAKLTAKGRAQVRKAASSFTYTSTVVCEGYADFGGSVRREASLSNGRAKAVCKALKAAGAHVTFSVKAYGPGHPVVVGGNSSKRADNRRVVVLVKR